MNRPLLRLPIASLVLVAGLAAPALAADPAASPRIVVAGEGEASVTPDLALLSLSVAKEAPTAREALTANNEAMTAVIAALKARGIADRDLQTSGFQIIPQIVYPDQANQQTAPKTVGYQVVNTLSVRVRDMARLGEVMDEAVSLGVNQGGGVSFAKDDTAAVLTEARKRAVEDAMARARTLAEAAGVGLGRVAEISEQPAQMQPPMPFLAKAERADAVPVQIGESAYRVQVTVTVEIDAK